MSRPLIRSGQWSQTTTGITQPAARLEAQCQARACHLSTDAQVIKENSIARNALVTVVAEVTSPELRDS